MADSTIQVRMVDGPTALASARAHGVVVDRPPDKGGQDAGFLGGELLLAGAGGRPLSGGVAAARARDIALRSAPVTVRGTRAEHPPRSSAIGVGVELDADLTPEGIDKPILIAERAGIVPATIRAVTPLTVRRKADGARCARADPLPGRCPAGPRRSASWRQRRAGSVDRARRV